MTTFEQRIGGARASTDTTLAERSAILLSATARSVRPSPAPTDDAMAAAPKLNLGLCLPYGNAPHPRTRLGDRVDP